MNSTLNTKVLETMSFSDRKQLVNGKKFIFKFDFDDLKKINEGIRLDIIANDYKRDTFWFEIKFWDNESKKYFSPIKMRFNEVMREIFLFHISSCPCVKNDILGNFLGLTYFWPPCSKEELEKNLLRVEVVVKKYLNRVNSYISNIDHSKICPYMSLEDQNSRWSSFITK